MVSVHTSPLQGIIVASEKRPPARGQTQRSTASSLWVVFTSVISWYWGPVRTRMQNGGGVFAGGDGAALLPHLSLTLFFLLAFSSRCTCPTTTEGHSRESQRS